MIKSYLTAGSLLAMAVLQAPEAGSADANADQAPTAPKTKSIVPAKYAGKYKDGGADALATFIKAQCTVDNAFKFDRFFELCTKNGLAADKVEHYKAQVAEKRHGAEGRARMTLRNMLATIARKNGKLVGLDGAEQEVSLPKPQLTGAAKAAADAKTDTPADQAPQAA